MHALLDVKVLVVLLDAMHVQHRAAAAAAGWLAAHVQLGWASCPLTQNGRTRILSLAGHRKAQSPATDLQRLGEAATGGKHEFLPDSVSLLDAGRTQWDHVPTSRQVTDVDLLALVVSHGGWLVILGRAIGVKCVAGAQAKHLLTLG